MTVDLRSDTLTQPTEAMRDAMARAVVGDDVFGEDPEVNQLQERCAALADKEAALFVPSGTMANLVACCCHTQHGDEVILERNSHLYRYEAGGFAAIAGVSTALLEGDRGRLEASQIADALRVDDVHQPRSRLLWLENTHNFGGGSCYELYALAELAAAARQHDLSVHLDGARVWNACIARDYAVAEVATHCDSLSFCFSKGLGCPVGSMLVGSAEFITRARRMRKRLGGGMRQAGVLAAAASYALDHHVQRLADDHRRARELAASLQGLGGLVVEEVETNIVFVGTEGIPLSANDLAVRLRDADIKVIVAGPQRLRLVTHLGVDDDDIEHACSAFVRVLNG